MLLVLRQSVFSSISSFGRPCCLPLSYQLSVVLLLLLFAAVISTIGRAVAAAFGF
jgi:hypothetical protein